MYARVAKDRRVASDPRVASHPRVGIISVLLFYLFFGYETIFNCSQNCWIDRNSAVLCFKRLFHIGVINVCPICEASFSHHTLYNYEKFGPYVYMNHVFPRWPKKDYQKTTKARHRTDFEAHQ